MLLIYTPEWDCWIIGSSTFSFLHGASTLFFSSGYTSLHSCQQYAGASFLHPLSSNLIICDVFDNSCSDRYKRYLIVVFALHLCDDYRCWASFHVPTDHLHVFFRKRQSIHVFCPLFNFFDPESCLILGFRGKAFSFSSLNMFSSGFVIKFPSLYTDRFLLYQRLVRIFIHHEWMLSFVRGLFLCLLRCSCDFCPLFRQCVITWLIWGWVAICSLKKMF